MGVPPSDFGHITPSEFFEIQEAHVEAHGGRSRRQTREAWRAYDRLKRLYPDTPVAGHA